GAGGTMPSVMNAANEAAVALFLERKITYLDITHRVIAAMNAHSPLSPTLDNILQADKWAREWINKE
ncbi:MAG: 1-deoxy-D-xylulose-5-phosphate reductoisomerase, partial [Chthonomonadaceae bacterium]|nr:1-deoxy-D-xylulose-5-phosphate reductoisomerase [Chthonomonadaceae bacterium]